MNCQGGKWETRIGSDNKINKQHLGTFIWEVMWWEGCNQLATCLSSNMDFTLKSWITYFCPSIPQVPQQQRVNNNFVSFKDCHENQRSKYKYSKWSKTHRNNCTETYCYYFSLLRLIVSTNIFSFAVNAKISECSNDILFSPTKELAWYYKGQTLLSIRSIGYCNPRHIGISKITDFS